MSDQVQQIKDKLSILDVVSQYVKLAKAGKNYKGLSPFTNEKTPSFFVSPDKGMYYDFSTSQGGDIFSFIQKVEGVDFKGALKVLADKAGVPLQYESKESRDARDRLYAVTEEAARFFETKLSEEEPAIQYLVDRGLEKATMRSFRVGFAPNDWRTLFEHLKTVGYTEAEMEEAGLIKKSEKGKYYDRFRSRIVFPVMDSTGRVVAFSGRIFGEPAKDKNNAKYLNSPETPLFDKSKILYGYDKAKQNMRKYDFAIIVEGQMDIVMSHQAGYTNTVAVSGTGLTPHHLSLIERLTKKIVTAFDADKAGIASSERAALLAFPRGISLKVTKIPTGKDPADCIQEDLAEWKKIIKEAQHAVDFFIQNTLQESRSNDWDVHKLRENMYESTFPLIKMIVSKAERELFLKNISNVIDVSFESVHGDFESFLGKQNTPSSPTPTTVAQPRNIEHTFSRKDDLEKTIAGILFWQNTLDKKDVSTDEVSELEEKNKLSFSALLAKHINEQDMLALQAEILCAPPETQNEKLAHLTNALAKITVAEKLQSLIREQRQAENRNDAEQAEKLMNEVVEFSKFKETLEHN